MGKAPTTRACRASTSWIRDRRHAAAAGQRLRRPLHHPSLRLRHADRGDAGSAGRRREGGQGALSRRLIHVRLAVREDADDAGAPGLGPFRLDAESLQSHLSRGRARDDAALPRRGHRDDLRGVRCARYSGRQSRQGRSRRRRQHRHRARPHRRDGASHVLRRERFHHRRSRAGAGEEARCRPGAGGAGLAAAASRSSRRRSSPPASCRSSTICWARSISS